MWGLRAKDVSPLRGTSKTKTGSFNATQSASSRTQYSLLNPPVGGHGTRYSILPTRYPIRKCIDRPQMPPSAFDAVVAVAFDRTDVGSLLPLHNTYMIDAFGLRSIDSEQVGRRYPII